MVDHTRKLDSLSEGEKYDLENIARTIPDLVIYMLKNGINDIYVREFNTKVGVSKASNKYISQDMTVYKKFPDVSFLYYVVY